MGSLVDSFTETTTVEVLTPSDLQLRGELPLGHRPVLTPVSTLETWVLMAVIGHICILFS